MAVKPGSGDNLNAAAARGDVVAVGRFLEHIEPSESFLNRLKANPPAKNSSTIIERVERARSNVLMDRERLKEGDNITKAVDLGDLASVKHLLKSGVIATGKNVNDALVDPVGKDGDAIAALLIDSYAGNITINQDHSLAEWVVATGMPLAEKALQGKGVDTSKAKEAVEIQKMFAIFDVEIAGDMAGMPGDFGYGVFREEWSRYNTEILKDDAPDAEKAAKFQRITDALANPLAPRVAQIPAEGERVILDLGYEGHVFNGVIDQRDNKTLLHIYDRGDDILGIGQPSNIKASRHVTKEIPAGKFSDTMAFLTDCKSKTTVIAVRDKVSYKTSEALKNGVVREKKDILDEAKKEARAELMVELKAEYQETIGKLEDASVPALDNLEMKGFKADHCATLGRKTNVRMLLRMEFGELEGDNIYKQFSKGSRLVHAQEILGQFPDKESFVKHCETGSILSQRKRGFSTDEFGKLYDKMQASSQKIGLDAAYAETKVAVENITKSAVDKITDFANGFLAKQERKSNAGEKRVRGDDIKELKSVGKDRTEVKAEVKEGLGARAGRAISNRLNDMFISGHADTRNSEKAEAGLAHAREERAKRMVDSGVIETFSEASVVSSLYSMGASEVFVNKEVGKYDEVKSTNVQVQRFSRELENVMYGGKVTQAGCTVLSYLVQRADENGELNIEAADGSSIIIQKSSLVDLQSNFEKKLFDRQFEQAKRIRDEGPKRGSLEGENFADVILDEDKEMKGDQAVKDQKLGERLAKKLNMDESVITRECIGTTSMCKDLLANFKALQVETPGRGI